MTPDKSAGEKKAIQRLAEQIRSRRSVVEADEQRLGLQVWKYLRPRGSMRSVAREMGITPQYLCDIAHGRRKISDNVLNRLMELR